MVRIQSITKATETLELEKAVASELKVKDMETSIGSLLEIKEDADEDSKRIHRSTDT